jgi:cholesterol oxidase
VRPHGDGYVIGAKAVGRKGAGLEFSADQVIFSAGTLGTQRLLHRMRDEGVLPRVFDKLGTLTRTNSEAILGAMTGDTKVDYSRGIAITSSWHPDEVTHIEPVRYGKGSNAMGMLATLMTDGGGKVPRPIKFVFEVLKHPYLFLRSVSVRRWSERTVIVLVMQTLDNSIRVFRKKGLFGEKLSSAQGHGGKNPTWIPVGNEATRMIAEEIGGFPGGTLPEIFNIPMTAHIIGGAVIGNSPEEGVIDPYQRVFGHPGLHVADGSTLSANLGVNPSLSIAAQAERAMSFWPNKGELDARPELGKPYERLQPIAPHKPAVPSSAKGALRWAARKGVA